MKTILTLIPVVLGLAFGPIAASAQTSAKPKSKASQKAADTKKKATSKAKAKSKPKASSKPKAAPKPKASPKPKAAPKPKAKTKPTAKAKSGSHRSVPSKKLVALAQKQIGGLPSAKKSSLKKLLNSGSKDDLGKVPGIGAVLAGNIIKSRPFAKSEDIVNVNGIGEEKLKGIVAHVKNPSKATSAKKKK